MGLGQIPRIAMCSDSHSPRCCCCTRSGTSLWAALSLFQSRTQAWATRRHTHMRVHATPVASGLVQGHCCLGHGGVQLLCPGGENFQVRGAITQECRSNCSRSSWKGLEGAVDLNLITQYRQNKIPPSVVLPKRHNSWFQAVLALYGPYFTLRLCVSVLIFCRHTAKCPLGPVWGVGARQVARKHGHAFFFNRCTPSYL
jgi:hypothetical protein